MAIKKKKKAVKRSAPAAKAKAKIYGMDQDFVIITGGGLIVVLLALYWIYNG